MLIEGEAVTTLEGFFSYVHADDEAEGERISRLARDVSAQFEMLTGEALNLFLDKDAIEWGEKWREKIDSSLASVAFFIPVLTPRYFMRAECRRELQFFVRRATHLGIKDLVLPLHYVNVPALTEERSDDDLIQLMRAFQWQDWRELRFADVVTETYRRGVAALAARLVQANRHVESTMISSPPPAPAVDEVADNSPGLLDRMAAAEENLPKLVETVESVNKVIEAIGELAQAAGEEIQQREKQGGGFSARVVVFRKLSRLMAEHAESVWSLGSQFASQLHEVDAGIRIIIEMAPAEVPGNQEVKQAVCVFFDAVREMSAAANSGLTSMQFLIDTIAPIEKMSRDLRPVLRRLRQGLTAMVEAREVINEWLQLIEASGVVCE
jgi:hypothetical protein